MPRTVAFSINELQPPIPHDLLLIQQVTILQAFVRSFLLKKRVSKGLQAILEDVDHSEDNGDVRLAFYAKIVQKKWRSSRLRVLYVKSICILQRWTRSILQRYGLYCKRLDDFSKRGLAVNGIIILIENKDVVFSILEGIMMKLKKNHAELHIEFEECPHLRFCRSRYTRGNGYFMNNHPNGSLVPFVGVSCLYRYSKVSMINTVLSSISF